MAQFETVAIVGVGLIGGSIGLALRERGLAGEVVGIGRGPESLTDPRRVGSPRRQTTLEAARSLGAIDRAETDVAAGVADAELIIVCTPVDLVTQFIVEVAAACPADALITDAGSTKEAIVSAVDAALSARRHGPRFVGSHPIAGDHRTGPEHARADLFAGRVVVVTPTDATRPAAVTETQGFWESLGANVVTMAPAQHDAALAMTSHLPHLLAAALVGMTPEELLPLTAGGWRDTTRVAGADPNLWAPIFATNRRHILAAVDRYRSTLDRLRELLDADDASSLFAALEQAAVMKWKRDALGD